MRRPSLAAALAIALIPATSAADDAAPASDSPDTDAPATTENRVAYAGPPGNYVPEVEPELPPPAPVVVDAFTSARDADAAAGRAFLFPTAITGKKGSVRVEAWFPTLPVAGLAMATYSITDRVEVGAGVFWIAEEEDDTAGALRVKVAPLRRARGGVALELQHLRLPDGEDSITVLSGVGTYCLDATCRYMANLHVSAIPEDEAYDDDTGTYGPALHTFGGASLVAGHRLKAVVDLITANPDDERVFAIYGGVRLARPKWSLDAGMVLGGDGDDTEALPVPLVGATGRW